MRKYPTIVSKLVNCHDAWLVGGAATEDNPKDIDVVVSPSKWNQACQLIPKTATVNSFGGWKFVDDGIVVDVWPEELNNLMTNSFAKAAFHPRSNTRLTVERNKE